MSIQIQYTYKTFNTKPFLDDLTLKQLYKLVCTDATGNGTGS